MDTSGWTRGLDAFDEAMSRVMAGRREAGPTQIVIEQRSGLAQTVASSLERRGPQNTRYAELWTIARYLHGAGYHLALRVHRSADESPWSDVDEYVMSQLVDMAKGVRASGYPIAAAVAMPDSGDIISTAVTDFSGDDPTGHAEILAIRKACRTLGDRHIPGTRLYSTAEPCPMCASTAVMARMSGGCVYGSATETVIRAAGSDLCGRGWSLIDISAAEVFSASTRIGTAPVIGGVLRERTDALLPQACQRPAG